MVCVFLSFSVKMYLIAVSLQRSMYFIMFFVFRLFAFSHYIKKKNIKCIKSDFKTLLDCSLSLSRERERDGTGINFVRNHNDGDIIPWLLK